VAELIVDASILSAVFLREKGSEQIRNVIESETALFAPSFWRFEVSNAVWKRKDLPMKVAKELIKTIWGFHTYTNESEEIALEGMDIAHKFGITFYDSFYIAMAKYFGIPLWTMDKVQAKAAVEVGVSLWER
jgi:predicted nucleic acid-binding protein